LAFLGWDFQMPFNFHYFISLFKDLEAFQDSNNRIRLFRPACNCERLRWSCTTEAEAEAEAASARLLGRLRMIDVPENTIKFQRCLLASWI
jgi:hypothetical protein